MNCVLQTGTLEGSKPRLQQHRMEAVLTLKTAAARALDPQFAALQREYGELRREVFEAEQVQRKLSGPRRVECAGYEIISETFASRSISGDFFCSARLGSPIMFAVRDIAATAPPIVARPPHRRPRGGASPPLGRRLTR